MDPDREWGTWGGWIGWASGGPSIFEDITAMVARRQVWDGLRVIVDNATERARRPGIFHQWVAQNYAQAQGSAIRRQTDVRDDVISLARLLDRIRRFPEVLSRDRYAARMQGWMSREEADLFFDRMVGAGRDHIDPAVPEADLGKLRTESEPIRTWVTKEVAHYDPDKGSFGAGVTFGLVHEELDLILSLGIKYREMIAGASMARSISMPAWHVVFAVPWVDDARIIGERIREREGRRERGEPVE